MSNAGTLVRATIPYALVWNSGDLEIRVEDENFRVHFEQRSRQAGDTPIPVTGGRIISASGFELPQDRLGRVAYTALEIQFPTYVPYYDMGERDEELHRKVLAVINRLLYVYRYATGESYVDSIPRIELQVDSVRGALKEDGTLEEPNRETLIGYMAGGPNSWLTPARTKPISEEARQFLREGDALPIPAMLYLNAEREYTFEHYRIAVVEAETAFEALVDQAVAAYYRNRGELPRDIERKLETGVVNLVLHHIPRCCGGAQFEGTPEHYAWQNDLYSLRKDVVHEGAPVTAAQARTALEAADKAMKWIKTRTP